jgi:hypothetical protein
VSGTATLAVVLLVFFAVGIGAGVVAVIALSACRNRRPPRPGWPVSEDQPGWPVSEDQPGWPVSGGGDWPRGGE